MEQMDEATAAKGGFVTAAKGELPSGENEPGGHLGDLQNIWTEARWRGSFCLYVRDTFSYLSESECLHIPHWPPDRTAGHKTAPSFLSCSQFLKAVAHPWKPTRLVSLNFAEITSNVTNFFLNSYPLTHFQSLFMYIWTNILLQVAESQ